MSEIFHFPYISYMSGDLKIEIRFDRFSRQFTEAQAWLGATVLEDSKPYMPHRTGSMQQRSKVNYGGSEVEFPGPYARFQYGGVVMVDPETNSPWARLGAKKVATDRPLTYSSPTATDHWFDTAKANHGEYWLAETKRKAGGG